MLDELRAEELLDILRGVRNELKRIADAVVGKIEGSAGRFPYGPDATSTFVASEGEDDEEEG